MTRRLRLFRTEEKAEVGKLEKFGDKEVGGRSQKNECKGSTDTNRDGLVHGLNELEA